MTHKKQTAVEWLEEKLRLSIGDELNSLNGFFVLAKEMEKQQIMDAYDKGEFNDGVNETAEQYYTETYNND